MSIDRQQFAIMCAEQAMRFGVNTHYLVALAELLSGIKDDNDGDRIGPFRRTATEWAAKGGELELVADDIKLPRMQCAFAALQALHAQEQFLAASGGTFPTAIQLYAIWPNEPVPPGKTAQQALDSTKDLIEPAVKEALDGLDLGNLVGPIKIDWLKPAQQAIAGKIIDGFKTAGCNVIAQAAALANSMGESSLDPTKINDNPPKEHSVGLFQCNTIGGVGAGKTDAFLQIPENNIALIIAEMNSKAPQFKTATDLKEAVTLFVKEVERPKDPTADVAIRMKFAVKFLPA